MIRGQLVVWAKQEFKLIAAPARNTISDILKNAAKIKNEAYSDKCRRKPLEVTSAALESGLNAWVARVEGGRHVLQYELDLYELNNVFKMDEAGLCYNRAPGGDICIRNNLDVKSDKTRITVAFCANADGSEMLSLLYIGWAEPTIGSGFVEFGSSFAGMATIRRRKFKLALEHLKKVWLKYNKERAYLADNLRTFLPGRMWPWYVGPDASLPIETLLDPTLPFYTMEKLMWAPGSADWCGEAALVNESEPCRVNWLTCPEQHPYNTVYAPCNAHVPFSLPSGATVEVLGPRIVPDLSLEPEDIDSSWDRTFRGADEDGKIEDGEVGEDDADSVATMDLDQVSADDTSADPQDEATEAALIVLFAESSPPPESGVVADI
ncbi:hypothetical protein PHMEG_00010208 [Phytophthora megakarya]|uniref:Uncharacterized protein n=1 Tax=Phytophthora megakarya TaxID=4795 RepID=A0A225WGA2_9STRA|nr:hypothetical protein PHMEG_00010208 [Phytophthora megakarya]